MFLPPTGKLPAPERTATGQHHRRRTGCAWRVGQIWHAGAGPAPAPVQAPKRGCRFSRLAFPSFSVASAHLSYALSLRCGRGHFLSRPDSC